MIFHLSRLTGSKIPFMMSVRNISRWEFSVGMWDNGVLDWKTYYRIQIGYTVFDMGWGDYRKSILKKIAKENLDKRIDECGNVWVKVGYTHFRIATPGDANNE